MHNFNEREKNKPQATQVPKTLFCQNSHETAAAADRIEFEFVDFGIRSQVKIYLQFITILFGGPLIARWSPSSSLDIVWGENVN